jgi:SPP1 family predicted phage head-tail adaptor
MRAGQLKHLCSLQAPGTAQDAAGQPIHGWAEVTTFWADIRGGAGLETIKAGAATMVRQVSIRTRYRTDITGAMRVVSQGVTYKINAVLPDLVERKHVDLACEVVT